MKAKKEKPASVSKPEKIRFDAPEKREYNPYYLKISSVYKWAKFGALAVLLCYLIVMLGMYRSYVTYDNLMYLIRDFDTNASVAGAGFSNITYDNENEMRFGLYRERLAVATSSGVAFFNTAGSAELSYKETVSNPALFTGEKYAMVCDIGGTSYSIYNTVARVLSKNADYTIQGAALSDSGCYALITRARENRYTVTVYDDSFKELSRIYKDKYVIGAALDKKGEKYAVVSCEMKSADFSCEVMSGMCRSDAADSVTVPGYLPLCVNYFDDGGFAVVCDLGVIFFSGNGEKTAEYRFSGKNLIFAGFYENRLLVTLSENIMASKCSLVLLSSSGNVEREISANGKVSCSAMNDKYIFYTDDAEFVRTGFDGTTVSAPCPPDVKALVPYLDDAVVCTGYEAKSGLGGVYKKNGENTSQDSEDVPET